VRAQQLDRESGAAADTAVLDIGVQDTGPTAAGGRWRCAASRSASWPSGSWPRCGRPGRGRTVPAGDLPQWRPPSRPFHEPRRQAESTTRPARLRAAGIGSLEALDAVAAAMRAVVTEPAAKGPCPRVADLMDAPYLRFCRSCDATHLYEMPFRLAALRAGLELRPGTSPPVLERNRRLRNGRRRGRGGTTWIRAYLRLLGPASPKTSAGYLDAPVREVKARWPADAVEVSVDGTPAWVAGRGRRPAWPTRAPAANPLLGRFDLFLQGQGPGRWWLPEPPAGERRVPVLGAAGAVLQRRRPSSAAVAAAQGGLEAHGRRPAVGGGIAGTARVRHRAGRAAGPRTGTPLPVSSSPTGRSVRTWTMSSSTPAAFEHRTKAARFELAIWARRRAITC